MRISLKKIDWYKSIKKTSLFCSLFYLLCNFYYITDNHTINSYDLNGLEFKSGFSFKATL